MEEIIKDIENFEEGFYTTNGRYCQIRYDMTSPSNEAKNWGVVFADMVTDGNIYWVDVSEDVEGWSYTINMEKVEDDTTYRCKKEKGDVLTDWVEYIESTEDLLDI